MTKKTHKKNNGLRNRFKCIYCGKGYMMEHNKNNHEKLCKERNKR